MLNKYDVELIGASPEAIDKAEDRSKFKEAMTKIGLGSARSGVAHTMDEAWAVQQELGFPVIIRPSFTMGGTGGGIAYNAEEFDTICKRGLEASPTSELLIEESLIGWKEYEMEVVRDKADNCIIVCSIENLDPMGVHTGDSITVAPAQTLTDKEYQIMRNASLAVLREIGVDTGGSNVQFAINPEDGRMIVIEMNPRVSRSSALASKATGFPIAKSPPSSPSASRWTNCATRSPAARRRPRSSRRSTTSSPRSRASPSKNSRTADDHLTTQMKSVGEVMAIGRTFQESFQKALRGLEVGVDGLNRKDHRPRSDRRRTRRARPGAHLVRRRRLRPRLHAGRSAPAHAYRSVVPGADQGNRRHRTVAGNASAGRARQSDACSSSSKKASPTAAWPTSAEDHRAGGARKAPRAAMCARSTSGSIPAPPNSPPTPPTCIRPTRKNAKRSRPTNKKIMVLGGGPNRIGQGIEFDYCCVHAALAMREDGYETIMVNCNPETVSTDYDTSDRLYFESLTLEDVLEIVDMEKPVGVIVQYGGQTPLKLALDLEANGVPIIGTSPDMIDAAEDRERFQKLLHELDLRQPPNRTARTEEEALRLAQEIGYPLVVRPSYVLGGRAMEIVHEQRDLERYMREAVKVSHDSPVLLDRFLNDAIEVDVDCLSRRHSAPSSAA